MVVPELTHVYGVFYKEGGRHPSSLEALHRTEAGARGAALTSRHRDVGTWEEVEPTWPHGPNPHVCAWQMKGARIYLFVHKLTVEAGSAVDRLAELVP